MSNIKTLVRGAYDIQKLRIMMGNRIVSNFKAKLGQAPSESEDVLNIVGKTILAKLRMSYKKITDGITTLPKLKKFVGDEIISEYTELVLVNRYITLESAESAHFKMLEDVLQDYPIYTEFLKLVKGCGPAMSGVIISEIDITKAKYSSSLWAYAGLDVAPDGQGRSKKKHHLVESEYLDSDGVTQTKMGITFNPFLKTKLVGVLAGSFLKCGSTNTYSKIYYAYKHRLENHAAHIGKTIGHRHNMAMRYMIKMFLCDLYIAWRGIEGLTIEPSYQEAKLGHKHAA